MKLFALSLVLVGCGTVKETPDAAVNGDGVLIDAKIPGNCTNGGDAFTGEHLDLWSNDTVTGKFCGVGGAVWTVDGSSDAKETATTAPNGRAVIACLPTTDTVRVDITVPSGANQCETMPGSYTINGIAIVDKQVMAMLPSMATFRVRSLPDGSGTKQRDGLYTNTIGAAYDASKGALMVHVVGATQLVTINAAHDTAVFYDGNLWAPQGSTAASGVDEVYFPNVAVGTATISSSLSGTLGLIQVPIEANKITYATIYHP